MEPGWDLRRDIDVSDCQKDQVFEGVETAEPTCPILDNFDDAIEAFRDGVGQTRPDEGEDVLGVGAKHPDEFLDRFKAASHCRRRPALDKPSCGPRRPVVPELFEFVLKSPGPIDPPVGFLQRLQRLGVLPRTR